MRTIQRIAKNTFVLTTSEIISKIISLFLYIAIARYLKAAGYGQFSFIMAVLALFQVLASFGLDKLTIREVAKNKENTHNYLSLMLKLKFFLGLITYALLVLFIHAINKPAEVIWGVHLIGLSLIFINLSNSFMAIFNAHERLEINAILLFIVKVFILALVLFMIHLKSGLLLILSIFVIAEALRMILSWLIYHKAFYKFKIKSKLNLSVKRIIKTALPFVVMAVASLIYAHIDIVMLSLMKGDEPVGWYNAAYILIVGLMFIPRSYTLSIFPAISRYARDSKKLLSVAWQKSVKVFIIVSLPISAGVIILADRFINLFYPSGVYNNSIYALRILMLSIPLVFVNSISMYLIYATNKQKQGSIIVLISMFVNIIFNLILIPKFSYLGAAWATVLAETINVAMFSILIYSIIRFRIRILDALLKPLLAVSFMSVFVYYFKSINLGLLICLAAFIYLIIVILLRTFNKEDRDLLGRVFPI